MASKKKYDKLDFFFDRLVAIFLQKGFMHGVSTNDQKTLRKIATMHSNIFVIDFYYQNTRTMVNIRQEKNMVRMKLDASEDVFLMEVFTYDLRDILTINKDFQMKDDFFGINLDAFINELKSRADSQNQQKSSNGAATPNPNRLNAQLERSDFQQIHINGSDGSTDFLDNGQPNIIDQNDQNNRTSLSKDPYYQYLLEYLKDSVPSAETEK